MKKNYIFIIVLLGSISTITAQKNISATIIDAESQEPIPFVTIEFNKTSGVVSNSEGKFQMHLRKKLTATDSLHINFLGYETKHFGALNFKDSIIKLNPKAFELDEVIVLNNQYTIDEIIAKTYENLPKNYPTSFLRSKLFFRESNTSTILQNDVDVKKTTIPELNQRFIDSILLMMPKRDEIYTEMLADFYTSTSEDKDIKNKLDIIKASRLYDDKGDISFDNVEEKLNRILKKHVKRDSYFKIKSGFFGTKADIDSTFFDGTNNAEKEETEKMLEEKRKREEEKKKNFLKYSKSSISYLKQKNIIDKDAKLNFVIKPKKYIYKLLSCIAMGDDFVYKISFIPKGKADYKGFLYINTDDFAVVRADFENVKNIKSFGLLGISFTEHLHKGTIIYGKTSTNIYAIKYAEDEVGVRFRINRPIKVIEKNKNVRGRRKQNEIATKIDFRLKTTTKKQLAVFENAVINNDTFIAFEEKANVKPIKLKAYDASFWKGYNIVEPNQAIKDFKSLEESK